MVIRDWAIVFLEWANGSMETSGNPNVFGRFVCSTFLSLLKIFGVYSRDFGARNSLVYFAS